MERKLSIKETVRLLPHHRDFVAHYLEHGDITEAYLECIEPGIERQSAGMKGHSLLKYKFIYDEVERQRKLMRDKEDPKLMMSRYEKRTFLARVARANPLKINPDNPDDENGDLVESVTRHYDREGNHIRTVIKLPSKLQAVEIDNRMTGDNEPEVHELRLGGGVMLVPVGAETLDGWEKHAITQQQELKSQKRPIQNTGVEVEGEFVEADTDDADAAAEPDVQELLA